MLPSLPHQKLGKGCKGNQYINCLQWFAIVVPWLETFYDTLPEIIKGFSPLIPFLHWTLHSLTFLASTSYSNWNLFSWDQWHWNSSIHRAAPNNSISSGCSCLLSKTKASLRQVLQQQVIFNMKSKIKKNINQPEPPTALHHTYFLKK